MVLQTVALAHLTLGLNKTCPFLTVLWNLGSSVGPMYLDIPELSWLVVQLPVAQGWIVLMMVLVVCFMHKL